MGDHWSTQKNNINQVKLLWSSWIIWGGQQSPRNIFLQAALYDAVRKRTNIPIQETKKEFMMILQQNKGRLKNDATSRRNPDLSSGIYLNATNVEQCRLVDENRRERKEERVETENKIAT